MTQPTKMELLIFSPTGKTVTELMGGEVAIQSYEFFNGDGAIRPRLSFKTQDGADVIFILSEGWTFAVVTT